MKEKPILFSTPMVQALLNTKPGVWPAEPIDPSKPYKRMTRRVVKLPKKAPEGRIPFIEDIPDPSLGVHAYWQEPKYRQGDILWVRETWGINGYDNYDGYNIFVDYKAGGSSPEIDLDDETLWEKYAGQQTKWEENHEVDEIKWRPSIFMPREAARIFLEVKAVRIERVQDITEEDALAEGVSPFSLMMLKKIPIRLICHGGAYGKGYLPEKSYKAGFYKLWDEINAKRGYSWESNPWVYVYEFMRAA
jgi:hypothetical protein